MEEKVKAILIPVDVKEPLQLLDTGPILEIFLSQQVGGYIERVLVGDHRAHSAFFDADRNTIVMVVNEEGWLLGLLPNIRAGFLYGTQIHGTPIAGPALLLMEGMGDEGEIDFYDLSGQYANPDFWNEYFAHYLAESQQSETD